MIKLCAFLGNFGSEYERTRHNAAWIFESSLSFEGNLSWQKKFSGQCAAFRRDDFSRWKGLDSSNSDSIYFLKPETYMNLSGQSIGELCRFYKVMSEEVLVLHDELELPLGTISLKWSGGLGGHNGLRSTKAALGTADFWRLRFGIGRPSHSDISGYVLSAFSSDEQIVLSQIFPQAEDLLAKVLLAERPENLLPKWGKVRLAG